MSRSETDRTGTAQSASQALVLLPGTADSEPRGRALRRPSAGFLAQLMVSADPNLRPSRRDRTRAAAALYAETAQLRA
ncbi:hypothetical protein [Methylobacterium iners]|uniref:Uncharacterized protein n=1 Tax=Methylobacterium iners TaxID=418707 RepID=A0ABQ4RZ78_9HYPH|nr:hypothetical protein [Methylobacterium iners]GJD95911.1 hypothetical protein OCOJLMKI_3127 [Methylobacterium iners]